MKDWPTVAVADEGLVITGGAGFTVSVNVAVPVPSPFIALRATENIPVTVGVPSISPVTVSTVNPAGRPIASKLVGELVAVIV